MINAQCSSERGRTQTFIDWVAGQLGAMPYGNDPNVLLGNAIKESIWLNDHLAVGQIREFRQFASGIRKPFEPLQDPMRLDLKFFCGGRIVLMNMFDGTKELLPAIGRERTRTSELLQHFFRFGQNVIQIVALSCVYLPFAARE
jgi:hypothetical protein